MDKKSTTANVTEAYSGFDTNKRSTIACTSILQFHFSYLWIVHLSTDSPMAEVAQFLLCGLGKHLINILKFQKM